MKKVVTIFTVVFVLFSWMNLFAQADGENVFNEIWAAQTWGDGAWYPSGALFAMEGPFDFDEDGMGEFLVSSSWSGIYLNGVYLLEAVDDTTYEYSWMYHFALDSSGGNFSNIVVSDLDGDSNPEILVLTDCYEGQDGLQIFELDPATKTFPDVPTQTWDLGLSGIFESGAISVANLDSDDNQEVIVSVMDNWVAGESHLMIFELQNKNLEFPAWHVEMYDTTVAFSGYLAEPMDLDGDGLMEVFTVAWDFFRVVIYENTGAEDEYATQCNFQVTLEDAFCNEGVAVADFDQDGKKELYVASTNGVLFVLTHDGDVSALTYENLHLLKYYSPLGLRGLKVGNTDSAASTPDDGPDIYIAGNYHEAVYDWEYNGGDITDPTSYTEYVIFQDDTTDDSGSSDQGKVRPAKLILGDLNNNGAQEVVFSSASLAADKPTLFVLEHGRTTPVRLLMPESNPQSYALKQNYPNPFNPTTQINFQIPQADRVVIKIYNALGQEIKTLLDQNIKSGYHQVNWDGTNNYGKTASSGIYVYTINAGKYQASKKMLMMR